MKRIVALATCSIFLAALGCGPESDLGPSSAEAQAQVLSDPDRPQGASRHAHFAVERLETREDGVYAITVIELRDGGSGSENAGTISRREMAIPLRRPRPELYQQVTGTPGSEQARLVENPGKKCPVLLLTLQPLHIEILGLLVDLQRLELTVTAQEGDKALLGDLLCSVAGLLDPDGLLGSPSPENLTKAADLLGEVLGALLSGIVGGLVDGLAGKRTSENTSATTPISPPATEGAPVAAPTQ